MKPEEYIINKLRELSKTETQTFVPTDISQTIFTLLMSKKFRKYAVTPGYEEHILSAIRKSVLDNEPIKLTFVFGGYKLWCLAESPTVDWAELFSLMYYAKWLKPICELYEPGVWFDFYSDDVILEVMNNIPKSDTEAYLKSFKGLLHFVQSYLPKNLNFTLNRVGDQYESYEAFELDLENSIEKIKTELNGEKVVLTPEQTTLVELNVKLSPEQSNDPDWREKVFLIHEGYAQVSKRRPYYRTPEKIMLITRPVKNTLAVGTTKKSVVKFWIGTGVLEKKGDGFIENVFSPSQLDKSATSFVDVHIPGLEGKNFSRIRILD